MLTKADDYPIHQRPEPIAYSGSNRNFYDRYFFNGYDQEGELFFAAALGVYPQLNIMDASFCVVYAGKQYNVHASKHLKMERLDTQVGCIGIEVIEALKSLSITCHDPENGVQADLRFMARHAPIEEPRFTHRTGTRLGMDSTRMTQNGTYDGWIQLGDKRFNIKPEHFYGTRDRSWGIRPVGAADTQTNPDQGIPQFYWLWAPLNFAEFCSYYHLNADSEGRPWNTSAIITNLEHKEQYFEMADMRSSVELKSGTRHAKNATIHFCDTAGGNYKISLDPVFNFYMKGLGYGHPSWSHGLNHGELEQGYDEYELAQTDPGAIENLHIQAFCKARLDLPEGSVTGCGILEQLVIGPFKPALLRETLDMAD